MYKVGIIGVGWVAIGISDKFSGKSDTHLQAYSDCPDTRIIALCDIDICRIPWGYKEYTSHLEMVQNEDLDIISVCTSPETHCQIVCDIAPYGVKAILCEKPIALTLEDADKMIETCHKNGTILQVNHQRAFTYPKFRFSRDIIDTGSHMFESLVRLFGCFNGKVGNFWLFGHTKVEIEYVDTSNLPWDESHIFGLDCTHNTEPMITKSIQSLVDCLKYGTPSQCRGEDAREALRLALIFKEEYEKLHSSNNWVGRNPSNN